MTETAVKPTIVLVPGAWHLPEGFDAVRELLTAGGFPSVAVALPSVGAEPPTKGLNDDIAAVHAVVEELANEGKQVVVVAHSYGGLVGSGAVEGLGYAQRAKAGEKGGVISVVYMAAFAVPKGLSLKDMLGGQFLPWMQFDDNGYSRSSDEEKVFYHDLSPAEQQKWISKLQHISARVFTDPATYEPWHEIPCTYFFCKDDQAIPLVAQEQLAKNLGVYTEFSCDASHSPFLSMPDICVKAFELAAQTGAKGSGV